MHTFSIQGFVDPGDGSECRQKQHQSTLCYSAPLLQVLASALGGGNGLLPARNYCTRQPVSAEFSLRGGCQLLPLDVPHSQQQRRQFQFSSKTQKLFHNLCKLAHEQQTKSAGLEISLVLKYETKKGTLERG